MREGLELLMRRRGHSTRSAEGGDQGLRLLEDEGADLVITDLKMARVDGMKVLEEVKGSSPDTEVLVITGYGTVEKAVQAMKLGACDFITKPFSSEEFAIKVDRILRERRARLELEQENLALRVKNTYLRSQTGDEPPVPYGEMVGESDGIGQVKRLVARVARSDSTAMIYGESGTGKELVARAIHARSGRHGGPFIRVNCGAMPEGLLDSELFGHEAGAFTDARKRRRGRFELADGGTIFLDEISTVSHGTQVRLLRVLQERELERVGGEETISVDVADRGCHQHAPRRTPRRQRLSRGSLLQAPRLSGALCPRSGSARTTSRSSQTISSRNSRPARVPRSPPSTAMP